MSKVGIAVIAFMLGVCCSGLLGAGQLQRPKEHPPTPNWPQLHSTFDGGGAIGLGPGTAGVDLSALGSIPMFNPLENLPIFKKFEVSNTTQRLDGFNCTDCAFQDAVLLYGGGAIDIRGSKFTGTTELQLEGAAANTVALLEFLHAIPKGKLKYKLPIPNKLIIRRANTQKPQTMDFTAPYIGPR